MLNHKKIYEVFEPMIFKYTQRNDINHFGSLAMTMGIAVEARLVLPDPSPGKFDSIDRVLDYCLSELNIYDHVNFKNSLMIFNVVWCVLPTLNDQWA